MATFVNTHAKAYIDAEILNAGGSIGGGAAYVNTNPKAYIDAAVVASGGSASGTIVNTNPKAYIDARVATITGEVSSTATSVSELLSEGGGILEPGTYSGDFDVTSPVTVDARGSTFTGKVRFKPGSDGTYWRGGVFSTSQQGPDIFGSDIVMDQIEVTNTDTDIGLTISPWNGVVANTPQNVTIKRSYFHDIGSSPVTNFEHGIYNQGDYTIVEDCWIEDCATRGIQIYNNYDFPNRPYGAIIRRNVINNCGRGATYGDNNAYPMGIVVNGQGHLIEANYIGNSSGWHVGRGELSGNSTVQNNFWYGTNGAGTVDTSASHGFTLSSSGNGSGSPSTLATWKTNYLNAA